MNLSNPAQVCRRLDDAAEQLVNSPLRRGSAVRLPARGRLLATGDLHDNPLHWHKIVAVARLDQSGDNHVTVHELIHGERLINGVDLSHRMLIRVADLVCQFPQQAHPLLANHELSQLTGAGVSKGAGNSVELFNEGVAYVFGNDADDVAGAINRFIAAMPLALVSESGVLCAHSLPSREMMFRFDIDVLERPLAPDDYLRPAGAAYVMTWGRGYTEETTAELARQWSVRLFVLGHMHAETGIEHVNSRTIVLNSDHQRGVVLPIDLRQPMNAEDVVWNAIPLASIAD